jgi:hypothetical protein
LIREGDNWGRGILKKSQAWKKGPSKGEMMGKVGSVERYAQV